MAKKKIKVLQIGQNNWSDSCQIPDNMVWNHADFNHYQEHFFNKKGKPVKPFGLLIFTDHHFPKEDMMDLLPFATSYSVFYDEKLAEKSKENPLFRYRKAEALNMDQPQEVINHLALSHFPGQAGASENMSHVDVFESFSGDVSYEGNSYITLQGQFGDDFTSLLTWRYNIVHEKNQPLEMWFEFIKDASIELQLKVYSLVGGSSEISRVRSFSGQDLEKQLIIDDGDSTTYLSVVLLAKGQGQLKIGALHQRWTRLGAGAFIAGGQRLVDDKRQELIAYFSPGDMKPPLNVYFSGYRSAEGFEGYWMMANMNAPFILIGDPRIEGGSFYMGSDQLENQVTEFIKDKLTELQFTKEQLILSGLSMGTFGASYYASKLQPHAVIIGKPLFSLGNIALNGYRVRPDEFGTAFDMVKLLTGGLDQKHIDMINNKFWDSFDQADLSGTLFAIAYMKNDDYDSTAYYDLLDHIKGKPVKVISKGVEGRHNDNSGSINQWFLNQYARIMSLDFGRRPR
ncbi:accessory Sec system protein Asp2 [Streptococcus hongkongensis]|nr:accessory secretory protein Asp2 [Streptococcus uberis]